MTTVALVAACSVGFLALSVLVALFVGPAISTRRQDAAAARVATYVRRQEQARRAEAAGRFSVAAALRHQPRGNRQRTHPGGAVEWLNVEAIAEERQAPDAEPFARAHLDAWPAQVSGTGHPTAAQPAAVVDRTGVVLELYPPRPSPRPRPAGSEAHPAGRHARRDA